MVCSMSTEVIFKEPETHQPVEPISLRETVQGAIKQFLKKLGPQPIINLHELFLEEVEAPLLQAVMEHTDYNQSKAAILLGLSRGTLRKKLKQYDLL